MLQSVAALIAEFFPALVETIQPRRRPAAQPFEKRRAQSRKSFKDAAGKHGAEGEHRFDRVAGGVRQRKIIEITNADVAVVREIDAVKRNRDIEIHGGRPKRIIIGIVKRPAFDQVVRQDQGDSA